MFGVQQEASVLRSFSHLPYNQRFSTSKEYTNKVVFGHHVDSPSYPSPTHDRMVSVPVYMNTTASADNNTVYIRPNVEYTIPVTALHSCKVLSHFYRVRKWLTHVELDQASTDDPNELSFTKDEVLFVYETTGTWWQAKRSNGEIGMIPSNYVSLVFSIKLRGLCINGCT